MPADIDPYSLVYNLFVNRLRASGAVGEVIRKADNVVSLNDSKGKDQLRSKIKEADLPEIVIYQRGVTGNFTFCVGYIQVIRDYELVLTTPSNTLETTLSRLEWGITCAFAVTDYADEFNNLLWKGAPFVASVALLDTQSGESNPEFNRGIQGWAARWQFRVKMHFQLPLITAYNADPNFAVDAP